MSLYIFKYTQIFIGSILREIILFYFGFVIPLSFLLSSQVAAREEMYQAF